LFQILAEHDRQTAEHSLRVRSYALWLAEEHGLSSEQSLQLSLAALMHDIGKICLPGSLLNKPGRLTGEEHDWVRMHPVIGEHILRPLLPHPEVLAAVRGHHERTDGKGYPDGLRGEHISLLARILAVADCFDAMTSSRSYQQPLLWPEALRRLRLGAGSQFDGEVVESFALALQRPWAEVKSRRETTSRSA